jgi:hypothetical protein
MESWGQEWLCGNEHEDPGSYLGSYVWHIWWMFCCGGLYRVWSTICITTHVSCCADIFLLSLYAWQYSIQILSPLVKIILMYCFSTIRGSTAVECISNESDGNNFSDKLEVRNNISKNTMVETWQKHGMLAQFLELLYFECGTVY